MRIIKTFLQIMLWCGWSAFALENISDHVPGNDCWTMVTNFFVQLRSITNRDHETDRIADAQEVKIGPRDFNGQLAQELAPAISATSSLRVLCLQGCEIGPICMKAIGKALRSNATLKSLDLSFTNTLLEGTLSIFEALKANSTLEILVYSGNYVGGGDGGKVVFEALAVNSSLKRLFLSKTDLGSKGAIFIADAIKINSTLEQLYMAWNAIQCVGTEQMSAALKVNSSLKRLNLSVNNILMPGAQTIADACQTNSTLTCLSLKGNFFGWDGEQHLMRSFQNNLTLRDIKVFSKDSCYREAKTALAHILLRNRALPAIQLELICCVGDFPAELVKLILDALCSAMRNQ